MKARSNQPRFAGPQRDADKIEPETYPTTRGWFRTLLSVDRPTLSAFARITFRAVSQVRRWGPGAY